jgi:hypothetical protein
MNQYTKLVRKQVDWVRLLAVCSPVIAVIGS